MFDSVQLRSLLELHERSFALLKWVRSALNQGKVSFSTIHRNSDSAEAAAEWIQRNFSNIPHEARPRADQVTVFAKLFVAFLSTSFRLTSHIVRMETACGCWCSYCAYLQAGPALVTRVPSKKDVLTATELKRIYLEHSAAELGITAGANLADTILSSTELAEDISVATWGFELVRRSEYASQGETVLALWRQFAWQDKVPRRKFKITPARILLAEQRIFAAIKYSGA